MVDQLFRSLYAEIFMKLAVHLNCGSRCARPEAFEFNSGKQAVGRHDAKVYAELSLDARRDLKSVQDDATDARADFAEATAALAAAASIQDTSSP